jgi:hypothetical protein
MRLGVVSGWLPFDESFRGWPKLGVSPRRRIRQNAQKKCQSSCSKQKGGTWEMELREVQV